MGLVDNESLSVTPRPSDLNNFNVVGASREVAEAIEASRDKSVRPVRGYKWALSVAAILSSVFFFSLDQTVVADIIPDIVDHFGAVQKLPWVSVTLLLTAAGSINFWAKMYGQFDPKWLYVVCVFGFEAGSALCGTAPSMNALIIGRAIAGLGGAGMYLGVTMLLSIFTTEKERPAYFGLMGAIFGLGTVLGPIIGGAFADSKATWRWAFYINLCIGGLFAPVYFFYLPSRNPRPGVSPKGRLSEIDGIGTVLQIGAFISGIMAMSFGGVLYDWNSGRIIGLFVCSGVLFILLGLQQGLTIFTTFERRVFPVQYAVDKEMVILFAQIAAASSNSFITIYFIPLYFQFVQHDQALRSGVRLLPYIIPMVFGSMMNGILMEKLKHYMPWFLVGGTLIIAANSMLYYISLTVSAGYIYGALVLSGLGTGLFISAPFSIAQWLVPPSDIALAVGFISCSQVAGVAIALSMANAVFLNLSQNSIAKILPGVPKAEIQGSISGVGGSFLKTLDPSVQEEVLQVLVQAIRRVFIFAIVAGCISVVPALFMNREAINVRPGPGTVRAEDTLELKDQAGRPDTHGSP